MNRPIRRVAASLFLVFALVAVDLTYLQVVAGPRYRDDPRNARVVLSRTGRERGPIVSTEGEVLAESRADPEDLRRFARHYPHGGLYAHTVGYSSLLFGDSALEAAFAGDLRSGRGPTISGLISALLGADLRPKGLRLTLHHGLQQVAAQALGTQPGAVVALEPGSGAVLAMVSFPTFDPNELVGVQSPEPGERLEEDPGRPLLNRAIGESYPPGSSFKTVTAAAAFESGFNPESTFPDPAALQLPGSTAVIRNFDRQPCGDGSPVTLARALVRSCNTIFGQLGMELGAEVLVGQAQGFGFNAEIPFDLPVLASRLPSPEEFQNDLPALAQTAIGQRDVQATAFQMALVATAVANDGVIPIPYLVGEIFNQEGEVVSRAEVVEWRRAMSPAAAQLLTDLMERVVTEGTGQRAAVPGVRVAGKTGTAQVPDRPPHAWFIAFAPVDQPRIAVAVVVEHGGDAGESATGGGVAAPIAQQVMAAWLETGG